VTVGASCRRDGGKDGRPATPCISPVGKRSPESPFSFRTDVESIVGCERLQSERARWQCYHPVIWAWDEWNRPAGVICGDVNGLHQSSQPRRDRMSSDLRVFISSTYADLREHREEVVSALRRVALIPVRLEDFGASDDRPLDAALGAIDSADIVLLLVAWRLGYVPPETDKSLVELEYERALATGKPTLCFLLDENHPWPPNQIASDYKRITGFEIICVLTVSSAPLRHLKTLRQKLLLQSLSTPAMS